jgi:hypothetical protein
MELPTIKIKGKRGILIINEQDLPEWRAKGYVPIDEAETEAEHQKPQTLEQAIESMTVPELREYAEGNEIDISGLTKKADIVEAIEKAEWERPQE